ncbi:MAG: hypothetical protein ACKOPO_00160 [Novosphingobium sp.]
MYYFSRRHPLWTLAVPLAFVASSAHAAPTSAGSIIENTATASYSDGSGQQTVVSNTVSVKVDELLDVTLTSQDSGAVTAGTGTSLLTYKLTNTGNGPEAFLLTADPNRSGNDFVPSIGGLAYDTDGDGRYTAGVDRALATGEATPLIDPDQFLTVFVLATAPASATNGQNATINLRADAVTGTGTPGTVYTGKGANGSDAVVGLTNADADADGNLSVARALVSLGKSALVSGPYGTQPVPGATITFTLTASVSGSGSVSGLRITDGIPAGTTYTPGTLKLGTASLSDADDSDSGKASSSGIDVNIGAAAAGSSHAVSFSVTINKD